MKKLVAVILLVAIIASSMAFPAFAKGTNAVLTVEKTFVRVGDTADVTISLSNNPGIASLGITVSFDEGLTLIGAENGDALSELNFTAPKQLQNGSGITNFCRFAWTGSDNVYDDGVILTLTFVADKSVTKDTLCKVEVLCEEGDIINDLRECLDVDIEDGIVNVITYLPGDVDGNETINMVDVLALCQYYVDGCKYDPNGYAVTINENAGDVDGSGVLNMLDVLMICQYYVDGCKYDPNGYAVRLLPGNVVKQHTSDETTYSMIDTFDITTLDYVYNNRSSNGDYLSNFIEGLLTQDNHGTLVPGMAERWEANEDASVWTFYIRDNAYWVTYEGEVYDQVKAEDFVTGLKHAVDDWSGALSLVEDLIVNLKAYKEGTAQWEDVGIKAKGNKLTYTLTQPCGYFDGMTTYSILYPINAEFLASKGDNFGLPEPSGILYNGCYILTSLIANQEVRFDKNEKYYDKDNVFVDHVKVTYTDGKEPDQNFMMFTRGEVTSTAINSSLPQVVEIADRDYADNQYKSMTTATTFWGAFNFDRQRYTLYYDTSVVTTNKNEAQKADTKAAILNKNFRLAVYAAYSTKATEAVTMGEERALDRARNTLVPYTFAAKTDGTAYGALVTKYLEELEPAFAGINLNDGQDAWYNVERARAFAEAAKTELGATISEWPIKLDYPVNSSNENNTKTALAMKESIESALAGYVEINLVMFADKTAYYSSFYDVPTGADNSIDFAFGAGWGPDYGDPLTYINCYNAENGDMLNYSGLNFVDQGRSASNVAAIDAIGLDDVLTMLKAATVLSGDARIEAFAKIEATLLANGIIRPYSTRGANLVLSKVVPFTAAYGLYGQASYNVVPYFKYMKLQDTPVLAADYYAAKEAWLRGE